MDYETRRAGGSPPEAKRNIPLLIAILGGLALVGALLYYGISAIAGALSQPTPEEVVQEFRDAGLEVGEVYPVEEEPQYEESPVPKVEESGVRFVIPSACPAEPDECGGRVFSFETEEDLELMEDYYKSLEDMPIFGPALKSHLYRNDLLLLQIGSDTKKSEADEYGEVFENM